MSSPETWTFWERVKDAYKEAGLGYTQKEVADSIGIEQPSISDWNKPGGYPTVPNAIALARKANVCVEWLYTGRGPRRLPPKDGASEHLWQVWNKLNPVTQGQVLGFAQSLRDPEAVEPRRS